MFTASYQNDVCVVSTTATHQLDASVAPDLRVELEAVVESGVNRIILDVSNIEFMDSSALGALVSVLQKLISCNGELMIVGASETVRDLITLTRLDKLITLHTDMQSVLSTTH